MPARLSYTSRRKGSRSISWASLNWVKVRRVLGEEKIRGTDAVNDERFVVFVLDHLVLESGVDLFSGGTNGDAEEAVGIVAA